MDHYGNAYGKGMASKDDRRKLLGIIGKKQFDTTIRVDDECTITLLTLDHPSNSDSRTLTGGTP